MSRPDDIPQDVWGTAASEARAFVEWVGPPPDDSIAEAEHVLTVSFARVILAERRCASIAEMHEHRGVIAAAIRSTP